MIPPLTRYYARDDEDQEITRSPIIRLIEELEEELPDWLKPDEDEDDSEDEDDREELRPAA